MCSGGLYELKAVLMCGAIRKDFFNRALKDEKKVVKAFIEKNSDNMLKAKLKVSRGDGLSIPLFRWRIRG
jgi:hypothetical protein